MMRGKELGVRFDSTRSRKKEEMRQIASARARSYAIERHRKCEYLLTKNIELTAWLFSHFLRLRLITFTQASFLRSIVVFSRLTTYEQIHLLITSR